MAILNIARGATEATYTSSDANKSLAANTNYEWVFVHFGNQPVKLFIEPGSGTTFETGDTFTVDLGGESAIQTRQELRERGFLLEAGGVLRVATRVTTVSGTPANNTISFTAKTLHGEALETISVGIIDEDDLIDNGNL